MFRCIAVVFGATAMLLASFALNAQIAMDLKLSQRNYLKYEPVHVKVTMRNYTAHAIAFGEKPQLKGELYFEIKRTNEKYSEFIAPLDQAKLPPVSGTIIPSGGTVDFTFDISSFYNVAQTGAFSVRAVVRHPQLPQEYISPVLYFNVVPGIKIWSADVGVPDYIDNPSGEGNGTDKIKTRHAASYSYFTGKEHVYMLEISDSSKIYLLQRIGFDIGGNLRPQFQVDFLSRLNVLVAASPKVYAYYQYALNGQLEKKQVLVKTTSTPTLVTDEKNGFVSVAGGREAKLDTDYQEIKNIPFAMPGTQKIANEDDELLKLDAIKNQD